MGSTCSFCGVPRENIDFLIGESDKKVGPQTGAKICPACAKAMTMALSSPEDVIPYHVFMMYRHLTKNNELRKMGYQHEN